MISIILFITRTFLTFLWEYINYIVLRDYETFVHNVAKTMAKENIFYVKLFQALSLNENSTINKLLLKYTDNVVYNETDVNISLLEKVIQDNDLTGNIYKPINSGTISLVYKMKRNLDNKLVILKVKRNNIEKTLNKSLNDVLFFLKILSFFPIPILNTFDIHKTIKVNIDFIYTQLDFKEEVKNMQKMRKNCKNMNYVKIPDVYEEVTQKFNDVIMMEFIEGVPIEKVLSEDYDIYSKLVVKFGSVCTMHHGFAHGDLHAGNILFIKEGPSENPIYKLGIIDFGIMISIDENFKNKALDFFMNLLVDVPKNSAVKFFHMIFEPKEVIQHLNKKVYEEIVLMFEEFVEQFIFKGKNINQGKFYELLQKLNIYLKKNNIIEKYGLTLHESCVKLQVATAMSHGVTFHLSKDKYVDVANEAFQEMFHLDIFSESNN